MRYKLVAGSIGLLGYGAMLGWAITGDHMEAKMKSNQRLLGDIIERKSRELVAAQELLMKAPEVVVPMEASDEPTDESEVESIEEYVERTDAELQGETPEETRANLRPLVAGYVANEEDLEAFAEMAQPIIDDSVSNLPPHVISNSEYAWGEEGLSNAKIVYHYWPKHRLMAEMPDQDPIDNREIDNIIGWRNLDRFGDESEDPDTVYIRNRRLEADFEVIRQEEEPPAHLLVHMGRDEFEIQKKNGNIRFRDGDE